MDHKDRIYHLKNEVLKGRGISQEDAEFLIALDAPADLEGLMQSALQITQHFHQGRFDLCSLINAKSGMCVEDCGFCTQSLHYDTDVKTYPLVDRDTVLARAQRMKAHGAGSFCIVTSGDELNDRDFEQVVDTIAYVRGRVEIDLDVSIGFLDEERAERLKAAGVRRVNHNLQSSRAFYPNIVTTHSYDDRLRTLGVLKKAGLEICCGGIMGMGETRRDRIELAFELARVGADIVPINFLNPRKGTPVANSPKLETSEMLKTIAVFRFILPKAILELAGGRELNLGEEQLRALQGGANGLIIGGYLTTPAEEVAKDREMVRRAGYRLTPTEDELDLEAKI